MFDIGFWELLTIFVIGVVVVGPQKLPEVVKDIYSFLGRIRRMYENAKNDLSRELELDEIKKAAQQADMSEHIKKISLSIPKSLLSLKIFDPSMMPISKKTFDYLTEIFGFVLDLEDNHPTIY